jgi:hypothetical protein
MADGLNMSCVAMDTCFSLFYRGGVPGPVVGVNKFFVVVKSYIELFESLGVFLFSLEDRSPKGTTALRRLCDILHRLTCRVVG